MKHTLTLSVLALLAVLLIAGCPRDTGNGSEVVATGQTTAGTPPDATGSDTIPEPGGALLLGLGGLSLFRRR